MLRDEGLFLLQKPIEAVPFNPRRIAWVMGSDGIPIELVEPGEDWWA
jgi:methylmalonyl-CoA/ethylmalonyl-CoA epimerase